MPHTCTLSYCALIGKCALIRSNTVFVLCDVILIKIELSGLSSHGWIPTHQTCFRALERYFCDICIWCCTCQLHFIQQFLHRRGWSGAAMVLGKLPVPGRPTILIGVGQGPTALAVGAGGRCLDIVTLIYPFSPLSPCLWEMARYRLKYCLKGL